MSLDTEETGEPTEPGEWEGGKPSTELGNEAKKFAEDLLEISVRVSSPHAGVL